MIAKNLSSILLKVQQAVLKSPNKRPVTLIAVSKTKSV